MKMIFNLLGASLIALNIAAADEPVKVPTQDVSTFNKARSVLGMSVKDANGQELGKVQDLVLDLEKQRLGYAVVELGSSTGKRMVAVPVTALKPASDHFVLNMSPAVLASAASIQNDAWPAPDSFAVGAPAGSEKGQGSSGSSK